ncbi:hypothetical protein ACFP9V_19005 [Deinococcus radiopugnans]|uniref:Uncharacterized protein n=1 Tax=Deinococcus radiopugnans ATCC 19172 TaxID=585398 RepID=A0A5C4Y8W0_9DEIO|nr:hypothetical protein [Deinococcus radiopugnans]MBB6016797.1 hypothetical protein [Deinococcus radiopugnans ATCC 19172]TNM71914.1 hypothetical protein FHR04_05975 [Deinococcus radiopugnans ATCC 19172]
MTKEQVFIALRPLRFGAVHLQPGDPVPVEAGRDYRLMQRLGQIGPAGPAVPAAPQEEPLLTPYEAGSPVVFVAEDGTYTFVTFLDALEAPEEVQEGMGLKEDDVVASVVFPEDPDNATFVSMASLLPEQPTRQLIEVLAREAREAALVPAPAQTQTITALQGRVAFLELLIQANREDGQPLADDFPSVKELRGNGIQTLEGLRLLASGEQARAHLIALDKIGEKSADKILAALTAPPVPEVQPEG